MVESVFLALLAEVFLILVIKELYLGFKRYLTFLHIRRWKRSLDVEKLHDIFKELFAQIDGFALSQTVRQKQDAIDYVYGEIEFVPFVALLSLAKLQPEDVFYDLGCGIGKAVFACAMVFELKKCVGIELLVPLYEGACSQIDVINTMKPQLNYSPVVFIQGDFFEINFDDATCIFINSTAFFGSTWENICSKIDKLPLCTRVITTSKPLMGHGFHLIHTTKMETSWGVISAYIHERKN